MTEKHTIKDIDFPLNHLDGDILNEEFTKDELQEIEDFYFKLSKLSEYNSHWVFVDEELIIKEIIDNAISDFEYDISNFNDEDYTKEDYLENIKMINKQSLDLLHKKLVHTLKNTTLNDLKDYKEEPESFSRNHMLEVFEQILVKNEVTNEHVINFLKENVSKYGVYYDKNKNEFSYSEYWDYRDDLSDSTIKSLLEDYRNEREEKQIENTYMGKFIKSQGYNVKDVFKEDKDKFLKEVYEELYAYESDLTAMQFTFVPNTTDFEAVAKLYNNEPVIIKAGTRCGFFDSINGGGCGMNIKSVKDFSLENLEFDISIHYNDYVPEAVYGGFIKSNKEQLEIIS